ncbi:eukaryotic translation initiation factor 4E [Puccinia graminis f. sp. tritici]|uniref:Eukaryotic translation initiation factor 4E n=2 Tax=Puccinia graminis f. sp. tritici TaxID=56615 RepID=E3KZI5_PUCGT|nr:translation initiation factor eIF-4E [Puccinia graminis f. sp. tritici CRL 75-36-700-3]XP_003334676.1 translation initiation factor eIF-4E [Puccinia graminis f. sp. tritici CRL 75-36-700-3]KAA1074839.1 eukaryotic translation initiation factor 4E [Puccinia graminis f. sp. tritici]EFP89710.1 translation initiation factor eIF-4E [Puccinia graminis f. sp. tritici CRL 75-36-700-3]EFP90257.1 translation initiation factor eIF-4E [Puccinia graminis f. sp. tritici CRL 75-36-700-3]KAA1080865.1 eukary
MAESATSPTFPSSQLPPVAALASSQAVRSALADYTQASSIPSSSVSSPQLDHSSSSEKEDQEEKDDQSSLEDGEIPTEPAGTSSSASNNPITIFSSQTEFNVKHPLYSTWTLWFDNATKNDKAKNWDDLIQQVMQVESVEEFWGLYHNIVPPSLIHVGSNYYLFKEGIKPAWEDPANAKGGSWSIQLSRDRSRDMIDKWWLYTMLAAIGETFETPYTANGKPPATMSFTDEVTGVVISARKMFFRISIWTRSADSKELAQNIGRHFKYGVLSIPETFRFAPSDGKSIQTDCEFRSHTDSQLKKKKPTFTV